MEKKIIYSDDIIFDDKAREEEEASLKEIYDEDYELTDEEWYERATSQLSDEKMNLDKDIDGVIIAFAKVGRWNGTFAGSKVLGNNVSDIFDINEDHNEWFGDGENIRAELAHHDGTHRVLFRIAEDEETAEELSERIYNNELDETEFIELTESLYPAVAEVYGWT